MIHYYGTISHYIEADDYPSAVKMNNMMGCATVFLGQLAQFAFRVQFERLHVFVDGSPATTITFAAHVWL